MYTSIYQCPMGSVFGFSTLETFFFQKKLRESVISWTQRLGLWKSTEFLSTVLTKGLDWLRRCVGVCLKCMFHCRIGRQLHRRPAWPHLLSYAQLPETTAARMIWTEIKTMVNCLPWDSSFTIFICTNEFPHSSSQASGLSKRRDHVFQMLATTSRVCIQLG